MTRGRPHTDVTLRASTVAKVLDLALAGAPRTDMTGGKRTRAHVDAILAQCGPGREQWRACRDMYARMGGVDVTFDLPPEPRPERAPTVKGPVKPRPGAKYACGIDDCPARYKSAKGRADHRRTYHGIYATKPRKDDAA